MTGSHITLPSCIQHDLTNAQTGLNYRIQISWPVNWERTKQLRQNSVPAIYILNGNALFLTASEIVWRSASNSFYRGGGIVVAIGYQNIPTETGSLYSSQRNCDLTPNQHDIHEGLGGADVFLRFVDDQVKPLIREQFPHVNIGEEAIFGHSFGGLCVLHSLFSSRGAFDAYFAASPSIWWDAAIIDEADRFCKDTGSDSDKKWSLQLSYGLLEVQPRIYTGESDTEFDERKKRSEERKMEQYAVDMHKRLRESGRLERVSISEFEGEDHGTVATSALLRALTTFFDH